METKKANKNPDSPLGKPYIAPTKKPTGIASQNRENAAINTVAIPAVICHGANIALKSKIIKNIILKIIETKYQ